RSDAVGRDRLVDLPPVRRGLRVPARADVHEPAPGRRDQPGAAEDAVRAARGDGRAAGDDRGRDPSPELALPRHRHPEPDRVRGHVPAARGPARPLPRRARRPRFRLPRRREGDRRAGARPPVDAAAGAVGAAGDRRGCRALGAGGRADPRRPPVGDARSVISTPAAKLRGYAALTGALLWAAIALHRPELVAAAAPFGLLLAVGLSATAPGAVDVRTDEAEIRTLEGDTA